jgi:hypothetical protein
MPTAPRKREGSPLPANLPKRYQRQRLRVSTGGRHRSSDAPRARPMVWRELVMLAPTAGARVLSRSPDEAWSLRHLSTGACRDPPAGRNDELGCSMARGTVRSLVEHLFVGWANEARRLIPPIGLVGAVLCFAKDVALVCPPLPRLSACCRPRSNYDKVSRIRRRDA